jgi:hypothetical protein
MSSLGQKWRTFVQLRSKVAQTRQWQNPVTDFNSKTGLTSPPKDSTERVVGIATPSCKPMHNRTLTLSPAYSHGLYPPISIPEHQSKRMHSRPRNTKVGARPWKSSNLNTHDWCNLCTHVHYATRWDSISKCSCHTFLRVRTDERLDVHYLANNQPCPKIKSFRKII